MKLINRAIVLSTVVIVLIACSFISTMPGPTAATTTTVMPISTNMPGPTSTQNTTPVPQYTKTAKPSTVVDTQDGKLFISNEYGFSILLPSDSQGVVYNRADLSEILIAALPEIELDDGGNIFTLIHTFVEEQTDECHPMKFGYPTVPVKMEQVSLGSNSHTKLYTSVVDRDSMQYIDYMTYGTSFCVHFWINLTLYYFDHRVDAQPPRDMLPYKQDELDKIIATFQWVNP